MSAAAHSGPDPRRCAAERQRRHRRRVRQGLIQIQLDVCEIEIAAAMIITGRLSEAEALRRSLLERELAKVITDWVDRWK